ncbi:M14 family zinc carboxypeptidase [Paenibacillus sp. KN14-4R]|uniref:M14 family zinc carboxypeptidase n=1 Tax=Paenibacillus sp. KN14-4R TaxID=3445773 RepID=UPI003FA11719
MRNKRQHRTLPRLLAATLALCLVMGVIHVGSVRASSVSKDIVDPYQVYTYELMSKHMDQLAAAYPALIEVKSIGKTTFGREIMALKLGKGDATVLIDGSQHAREWMGTNLIMYMIDRYTYAYEHNMKYNHYIVQQLLNNCSIWFVPMVNPDGVTLQQKGLDAFPADFHSYLVQMNEGSTNFKRWKANAEGIDINRQYPAMWSSIRNASKYPMFKNYKGSEPAEAAEARSMIQFSNEIDPEIAFSYHTSGEILYWNFYTASENLSRDKKMADAITYMTGYSQVKPEKDPSGGGFTDWFIAQFGRPGFTAELGTYQEETELPLWTFKQIWEQNQEIGLYMVEEGYKLWRERYPVETAKENIQLLDTAKLFNRPNESFPVGAKINSGKVTADAHMGEWYRIQTWLGPKWVNLKSTPYLKGHSEKVTERVVLKAETSLYHYPNQEGKGKIAELNPQSVEAIERWNDWILIKTWFGTSWIKEEK